MYFKSIYPYTLDVKAEYEVMTDETINNCLSLAEKTFQRWRKTSFEERRR